MDTLVFDVECYSNFFLIVFRNIRTREVLRFQVSPNRKLNVASLIRTLQSHRIVGFNSNEYDIPMIQLALKGYTCEQLKAASDQIIHGMRPRAFAEHHGLPRHSFNHVDLIQVAPLKASLKIYGARLHCKKMQDLPIDPEETITAETAEIIFTYCCNDLEVTELLLNELAEQLELREQITEEYGRDVRSKSDAQVAEQIISAEVAKINGRWPGRPQGLEGTHFFYKVPDYIQFQTPVFREMLEKVRNAKFFIDEEGKVVMPPELDKLDMKFKGGRYRMGIGGLHSSETTVCHFADDNFLLIDRDVASYYPRIILSQGLYPQHLGPAFLTVYDAIVNRRLKAKNLSAATAKAADYVKKNVPMKNWDGVNTALIIAFGTPMTDAEALLACSVLHKTIAESLKIAVNGSFGKLGNKWSVLFAPDLLIQVTLTGQLALLMLIEQIETASIPVLSANTDGIVMKCPVSIYPTVLLPIIKRWEAATGFETEETRYRAIYSKDVNNYIAIKTDGKVKGKGLYTCPWGGLTEGPKVFKLQKNPSTTIVIEAVINLLRDKIPLAKTIESCRDITKFVAVRAVTGGATQMTGAGNWRDRYETEVVGKAIRWFYSTEARGKVLNYAKATKKGTHNKVPKTDGAKTLMELPDEFPSDVNYQWYVIEAQAVLKSIGYSRPTLFDSI